MITLDDSALDRLASDPKFVQAFPLLKQLAAAQRSRGCCGKTDQRRASIYHAVKTAIVTLDTESKKKLKTMLNTNSIRLRYRNARGDVVRYTF